MGDVGSRRGFIPSNHVEECFTLKAEDWYHGTITRMVAEKMLMNASSGQYLVRAIEGKLNDYSLAVKNKEKIKHYLSANHKLIHRSPLSPFFSKWRP